MTHVDSDPKKVKLSGF